MRIRKPALVLDTKGLVVVPHPSSAASHTGRGHGLVIDYFSHLGVRCAVHVRVRPSIRDPDSEPVDEAAIAAGGGWIVTRNVR